MKKLLMIAAALGLSTASAAGSGQIIVTVNATVVNVCTLGSTTQNANGLSAPYTVNLGQYDALNAASQSVSSAPYYLRCTKGTQVSVAPGSGTMQLSRANSNDKLNVTYSATVSAPDQQADGDHFMGSATFTAAAGQWTTSAGSYSGTQTFTVSWN